MAACFVDLFDAGLVEGDHAGSAFHFIDQRLFGGGVDRDSELGGGTLGSFGGEVLGSFALHLRGSAAVVTADEGAGDGPRLALLAGLLRLGLATPARFFLAGHQDTGPRPNSARQLLTTSSTSACGW